MSLTLALNNALSGLSVNQRALSVISHNLANANTEGYTRQVLDLSSVYYDAQGSEGQGVRVEDISRRIDTYLQRTIRNQTSLVGQTSVMEDYFEKIQIQLGEPGADNSIDEYIQNFYDALQTLAETPDSVSYRELAVDSGITLAQELYDLAYSLEDFRYEVDRDIVDVTRNINQELLNLESLNISIGRANVMGTSKADLQDDIDRSLKRISEYIDIDVTYDETGAVSVFTNSGITLLDDYAYQLSYSPAASVGQIVDGQDFKNIVVRALDDRGQPVGQPVNLVSSGFEDSVTTTLRSGKLKGLLDLRDQYIPNILDQIDQLASTMRDSFNAIHNLGSAYPGTNELQGTRDLTPETRSEWEGAVRIAVLEEDGSPVQSPYPDELYTGTRPLLLDLASLQSAKTDGLPTLQTIVDEINNHFYPPPVKAELGNLNNIQLVADTDEMPTFPGNFSFDFDLDNISAEDADFFVTNITVLDSTGANITALNTPPPRAALNVGPSAAYITTAGSNVVQINAVNHGFSVGDRVFITDSGLANVNGIPAGVIGGQYFEITSVVNANSFTITAGSAATATGGVVSGTPVFAYGAWDTIEAGEKTRTRDAGVVDLDLSANPTSAYYDITVSVGVDDGLSSAGEIRTGTITYRIYNYQNHLLNDRYNATDVSGQAEKVATSDTTPFMRAILVDADGNEVPSTNGWYVEDRQAYLKLVTFDDSHGIVIDDLGSKEIGITTGPDKRNGTNRGFSHYFELNNFFASNEPTNTGDTVNNSAINMRVEQRLIDNANLISLGTLELSNQPADPEATPLYTYQRNVSNNTTIQKLAKLGIENITFATAGGLSSTSTSFTGYAGNILAYTATTSVRSANDNTDNQTVLQGFQERSDAFSGVNVDEELANVQIFQHAYSASARIITTTNELFQTLLDAI